MLGVNISNLRVSDYCRQLRCLRNRFPSAIVWVTGNWTLVTRSSASAESSNAENWFVATADNGTGEYVLDELILAIRSGRVQTHDLVWRQGMSDWLEMEHVPLLRMIAGPVATTLTKPVEPPQPDEPRPESPTISAASPTEEVDSTIVQPRLDLLIDNDWTIEPKQTPKAQIKPAPFSIDELIKRGASTTASLSQAPASSTLARPALIRPTTPKPEIEKPPPPPSAAIAVAHSTGATTRPATDSRTEVRPVEVIQEIEPAKSPAEPSHLSGRAPPKPRSSMPSKPPPSATAARTHVPNRDATRSAPTPDAAGLRSLQPRTASVSKGNSSAPIVRRAGEASPTARASAPPAATARPALPQANVKASPARTNDNQPSTVPLAVQQPIAIEPIGSLLPSATSLYPDEPQWRRSRRPVYVACGGVLAAAAILLIAIGSGPSRLTRTRAANASLVAAAPHESVATPIVAASAAPDAVPDPSKSTQATPSESSDSPSAKPTRRTSSTNAARAADATRPARKPVRENEAPAVTRPLAEPKTATAESPSTSKSTPSTTKKLQGSASSVASWDQGTVEHRSWMNPGF